MLLEDLHVVLKVAEFKSITAAAASLDMRVATASAALKRVEANLGTELFTRTTRSLKLSSAGERYLPQCEEALGLLLNAKQNMKSEQGLIDGELRIGVSSDLGRNIVAPWLDQFMQQHAGISLKLHLSDSNIDFYRDPVDIALRYGLPNDSSLYGFKICNVPRLLCASPTFIEKHGAPKHPNELNQYNGLFYQLYDIVNNQWEFSKGENNFKVKMKGNRATNDGDMVKRWCLAGHGLAVKSALDTSEFLLNGELVRVMQGYQHKPSELWIVCAGRQSITPAVRLIRDQLREKTLGVLNELAQAKILQKEEF